MRYLNNLLLALVALAFVFLGAAMPYLVSMIQDARLSGFRKNSELNRVNLSLHQEMDNVIPALEMLLKEYSETLWQGETVLTEKIALQAAFNVIEAMDKYSLLQNAVSARSSSTYSVSSVGKQPDAVTIDRSSATAEKAWSVLLEAKDGSKSLIWKCNWHFKDYWATVSLDDSTGKAVGIHIDNLNSNFKLTPDDIQLQLEYWIIFLQDHYDGDIIYAEMIDEAAELFDDGNTRWSAIFDIRISPTVGTELFNFTLEIASDYTLFNYK